METFEETILQNWADRFQCSSGILQENGTTWIPEEKYANQNLIVLWHIGKHTFAQFDPSCAAFLDTIKAQVPIHTSVTGDDIKKGVGIHSITSHDVGYLHYLPPSRLPSVTPPHPFHVRALSLADKEQLSALHNYCTPEEVDDGYVEIDHEIVFGCFHDDQLVSAASGYRMAGFMDIGVLTHRDFRRSGLGKAVVGALCAWAVSRNIIVQYRCNIENTGSLGVAKALNFQLYFRSESLVLS